MVIRASQKRSTSASDSLSVGSIISVPGTGKDMVGCMEAEVDQALRNIFLSNAAPLA
jgi:hypothetical protein